MTTIPIGYARCSTDKQDLAAQKAALEKLGVLPERIYTDHGLIGTNRESPGLDQALAAVRSGVFQVTLRQDADHVVGVPSPMSVHARAEAV
jgi:DNA invertase Pin-like site-specific DNA recombinase